MTSIKKTQKLLMSCCSMDELKEIDKAAGVIHRILPNNIKEKINGLSDFLEATDLEN